MKTYPEINNLSLSDAKAAIAMGEINFANVSDDYKPELRRRLAALRERVRRLTATEAQINATQGASHTPGHTTLKSLRNAASIVGARIRPDGFGNYALLDSRDIVCVCSDTQELRESLEVYFSGHAQWSDALAEMANA